MTALERLQAAFPEPWAVSITHYAAPYRAKAVMEREGYQAIEIAMLGPTEDAAVDALLTAWRDAVRPLVLAGVECALEAGSMNGWSNADAERIVARVIPVATLRGMA